MSRRGAERPQLWPQKLVQLSRHWEHAQPGSVACKSEISYPDPRVSYARDWVRDWHVSSTAWGGGGGKEFPNPISDLTLKMYTLFQTLWFVANSPTLTSFAVCGTSWRHKRCSCFFFFAINAYGNTRYSKNGIPWPKRWNIPPISDQNGKIYTLFQTRNAWKWYPPGGEWGGGGGGGVADSSRGDRTGNG